MQDVVSSVALNIFHSKKWYLQTDMKGFTSKIMPPGQKLVMLCLSQSGLHSSLLICFYWHHFKSNLNLTIALSFRRDGSYIRQFTGWRQNVLFFQFSIWNWHKDWCSYCTSDQGKTIVSCAINGHATANHLNEPGSQFEAGKNYVPLLNLLLNLDLQLPWFCRNLFVATSW